MVGFFALTDQNMWWREKVWSENVLWIRIVLKKICTKRLRQSKVIAKTRHLTKTDILASTASRCYRGNPTLKTTFRKNAVSFDRAHIFLRHLSYWKGSALGKVCAPWGAAGFPSRDLWCCVGHFPSQHCWLITAKKYCFTMGGWGGCYRLFCSALKWSIL